jgi:poly(3-hydroxybutyrate) depolymerase
MQVVVALQQYYSNFVAATGISTDFTVAAEHCLPTLAYGEECLTLASPYLGRCQVDGAGLALTALLPGELTAPQAGADPARLLTFDQTAYYSGSRTSLDAAGFLYVPAQCQDGATSCRLHVSFHGECPASAVQCSAALSDDVSRSLLVFCLARVLARPQLRG